MANEYKQTMNLPKTDFPMRAGLSKSEPLRIKKWQDADLYNLWLKEHEGQPSFILHDGPPYANGPIHIGHALNKILKDTINRYWSEKGFYTPYVPGWDCHGQPIEHKIEEKLGPEKFKAMPQPKIRELCRDYAMENIEIQKAGFVRLGVQGKWDDPYLTLKHEYEAGDVEVFRDIYLQGAIYKGRKPIHWCKRCHTALAEAEIEYSDEPSDSIYVKFKLTDKPAALKDVDKEPYVIIWTTTPWTLPANSGVALAPDADYVAIETDDSMMVMAEALVPDLAKVAGWEDVKFVSKNGEPIRMKGKDFVGMEYYHPIHKDVLGKVIVGDHVTLDSGTGAVHTAPGHGQEDYEVGLEFGLAAPMPVLDDGTFDQGGGPFAGMNIDEANPKIIAWLDDKGTLVAQARITHSYPHCWRCKSPVIFRATDQWFVSMDKTGLREKALEVMKDVKWYPEWAINRIGAMVADRPDWCISRQRSWGIPIPVYKCAKCGETVANEETFNAVIDLFNKEGSDAWFTRDPREYLPEDVCCPKCGGKELIPEKDILDVWWESGVSHTSVLDKYPELHRPADMYLEGSDQHRGWFQSSLLTSVGAYGEAPYKAVVSNGFTVDEQGRKMSKSLGNVIDPNVICDKLGADILRLWVASTDSSQDVSVSESILERTSDAYRRIRNTFRFLLSNLNDFNYEKDRVPFDELEVMDKWAIARLNSLLSACDKGYSTYRFHVVYREIYDYVVTELSSVFMDALKDRLYSDGKTSHARRSAQTALAEILSMLVRTLQPILSFTCDEVFEYMDPSMKDGKDFAILLDWYKPIISDEKAAAYEEKYHVALEVRDVVTKALEEARNQKVVNKSQEAQVLITAPQAVIDELETGEVCNLEEFFIVHKVTFKAGDEITCEVTPAEGEKCPRCWNIRELGTNPKHPEVCERCAEVLEELAE